jgi:hypothetical protein
MPQVQSHSNCSWHRPLGRMIGINVQTFDASSARLPGDRMSGPTSLIGPSRHEALRSLAVAFGARRKLSGWESRLTWSSLTRSRLHGIRHSYSCRAAPWPRNDTRPRLCVTTRQHHPMIFARADPRFGTHASDASAAFVFVQELSREIIGKGSYLERWSTATRVHGV